MYNDKFGEVIKFLMVLSNWTNKVEVFEFENVYNPKHLLRYKN